MSLLREGSFRFLGAMLKVSQLNGMDQNQWSWRQGRLQDRFHFLERMVSTPTMARDFDLMTTRLVRAAAILLIAVSVVMLLLLNP